MNILIFGDIHICLSAIKECEEIFNEIINLVSKYNVDRIISLGDNFDNTRPSALELNCLANFIKKLNNKKIILLSAQSHESLTNELSSLDHFGILSNDVEVVKAFIDNKHLFCGHFSIKESLKNYDAKFSKEDLKDYLYVFLGHIHSYHLIKPNIVHLGSCRYINFDESKDKHKIVALITDYGTKEEKVHFLKLTSPIPMIELELREKDSKETQGCVILSENEEIDKDTLEQKSSISQAQTIQNKHSFDDICQLTVFLDKLDSKTKIKVKILDFESFRQFLPIVNKYSSKFEVFKYDTQFEVVSANNQKLIDKEMTSFKESFTNWLSQQKIDSKIKEILEKEII